MQEANVVKVKSLTDKLIKNDNMIKEKLFDLILSQQLKTISIEKYVN
jgi:hypothetical protein